MGFINFDITVTKGDGDNYKIKSIYEDGGEGGPADVDPPDFNSAEFQQFQSYLSGETEELSEENLKQVGETLHKWLFPRIIFAHFNTCLRDAQKQDKKVRLRLNLEDPAIRRLPWEYMYDSEWFKDYLALFRNNPVVRYIESPAIPQALRRKQLNQNSAAKLLLAYSVDPADDTAVTKAKAELEAIKKELDTQQKLKRVTIEDAGMVHLQQLQDHLGADDVDMLHLIAACKGGEKPALILYDEAGQPFEQNARQVATLMRGTAKTVVLSAPHTQSDGNDAGLALAEAMMRAEVPAVVALHRELPPPVAGRFAAQFYRYLARVNSLDDALTEMRINIQAFDQVAWGLPAMYLRVSDGRLWNEMVTGATAGIDASGFSEAQAAANAEKARFSPFLQLNFNNQVDSFNAFLNEQRIGGCLVHNQPDISSKSGNQLLVKRMMGLIPQVGEPPQQFHFKLDSLVINNDPQKVWQRLAHKVGLRELSPPFTRRKQEKVADKIGDLLKKKHVFFFFKNADADVVQLILADFWKPLVDIILDPEVPLLPEGRFLCLAFFIDNQGRVFSHLKQEFIEIKAAGGSRPEPEGGWQPEMIGASFALPPVKNFEKGELDFLARYYDEALLDEVKLEMDEAFGKQPDFVIETLVFTLELDDEGDFTNWLNQR